MPSIWSDAHSRIGLVELYRCPTDTDDEVISSDIVATSFWEDTSPDGTILEDGIGDWLIS